MLRTTLLLYLLSCKPDPVDSATPKADIESRWAPAPVVLVVIIDTLARHHLSGWQDEADTTPNIAALIAEGAQVSDVLAVRGLTSVAVSSLNTGLYPRHHTIRNNEGWRLPDQPTLPDRFKEAGYYTIGVAANACQFVERSVDDSFCNSHQAVNGLTPRERDSQLMEELEARLDRRPAGQPLFVYVHLMNPHDPYTLTRPYYDTFHPEAYTGTINAANSSVLHDMMLGEVEVTDADVAHVQAVYRSQLRQTDEHVAQILEMLDERGLRDEAVVAIGPDHGESVWKRNDYLFHGCSLYNDVNALMYGIVAPGRLPAGTRLDGWVSQTDIGPTLADVAGIGWSGDRDGESLVDNLLSGEPPGRPVYLERGTKAAAIIDGDYKYIRDELEGSDSCIPYSAEHPYPGQRESLFNIVTDPDELVELSTADPERTAAMHGALCAWLRGDVWQAPEADKQNPLIQACP